MHLLILSEQQLKGISIQQAENDLRIVNDCVKLMENTLKPDVFFMRLNLLVEKSKHLANLEEYISFSGASSAAAYNEVVNKHAIVKTLKILLYFFIGLPPEYSNTG